MFAEIIKEFAPPPEDGGRFDGHAVGIIQRLFSGSLGPKEPEIREAFLSHSLWQPVALQFGRGLVTASGSIGRPRGA